jgi:hypothetical protein
LLQYVFATAPTVSTPAILPATATTTGQQNFALLNDQSVTARKRLALLHVVLTIVGWRTTKDDVGTNR